jgi:transcriptional regulator with XRE-family HTH domain
MTTAQLGRRLGITRQAVADVERRELDGNVTIAALARAADAMGCDVIYAVVPRQPLGQMLEHQALIRARESVDELAAERAAIMLREDPRHLWDE